MTWIFEAKDKTGRRIHLSKERWRHIVIEHPQLANCLEHMKGALARPTTIRASEHDPAVRFYYQQAKKQKKLSPRFSKIFKWLGLCHYCFLYEQIAKMSDQLHVHYDKEADFLELRIGKPTQSTYNEIGNDIFERIDDDTGKIKGFAIYNFRKRAEKQKNIDVALPVKVTLSA